MPAPKIGLTVIAYRGDARTLLAFNLPKRSTTRLAGFTIHVAPGEGQQYYLLNELRFERPGDHAQDPAEPEHSTLNAPIHKFRWLHVLALAHQGLEPFYGDYVYTVTPRYFDKRQHMLPLDPSMSASVKVKVAPFTKRALGLGFTRGFVQSQAFVHHFGERATIKPAGDPLRFDTGAECGANAAGTHYTYLDEYEWLGFTARQRVFEVLDEVLAKKALRLDVFAYDLDEPDVVGRLLTLAGQGRVRVILDSAALHHSTSKPKREDQFEKLFRQAAKDGILRGRFGRYAHDKIFIVSNGSRAVKVLTGSTNFSCTGLYVNANHVLVFDDPRVAGRYREVFEEAWSTRCKAAAFRKSSLATSPSMFSGGGLPTMEVSFSPHDTETAGRILDGIAARIAAEAKTGPARKRSVLFAVMEVDGSRSPVYQALRTLHADQSVFSYGISDSTRGIALYRPKAKGGVLATGKPAKTVLPPPFDQVPSIGLAHEVHHKFVVCGFNGPKPVVYCGSSNLASGGEAADGDNLIAIHDGDIATVFAIEALGLVDHFDFLDRLATEAEKSKAGKSPAKTSKAKKQPSASKHQAAVDAGWFLSDTDRWTRPYYDPADLRSVDRRLFGT
jgi:hypothetical protein